MGGRWRVDRQLGRGGMGAVYLVHDIRLNNRRAALKEMLDRSLHLSAREEAIARFHREAETLASFNHPAIPHIYDRFSEDDRIYMVMEFIEGMDLERLLEAHQNAFGRGLAEAAVARYAYQLCSVLDYLHRQNPPTLHRDLKPSNLICHPSGVLKVIDFGIAKVFNPGSQGTGLGTQGYAAPEQYKGQADARTDLYALGATLHHLLTARDPRAQTPFDFPRVSQTMQITPGFDELLAALLERQPENRPDNAEVVRRRLLELFPGIQDWSEDAASSLPDFHAENKSDGLQVPRELDGTRPLEILSFDEKGQPFSLLGVVKLADLEFSFVTPGISVKAGQPVDVYLQRWQGSEAWFESITSETPELQAKAKTAWQILLQQS